MKNPYGKTQKIETPWMIYRNNFGWEWRVLKFWKNPVATGFMSVGDYDRLYCAVKSPHTYGSYDIGDVWFKDIIHDPTARLVYRRETEALPGFGDITNYPA